MFSSILTSSGGLSFKEAAICTAFSIVLGLIISFAVTLKGDSSKNYKCALVMLPVLVQAVIMMVNGNLGAGVAVMGAFGLIRFRSAPGSAKDICGIFFAVAVGLATGMGYIAFAVFITAAAGLMMLLLFNTKFGEGKAGFRQLRITIPESLDYTDAFDDLMDKYTTECRMLKVKTTNMGSLFELTYEVFLRDSKKEKEFIDGLRCRNGNLTITCSRLSVSEL